MQPVLSMVQLYNSSSGHIQCNKTPRSINYKHEYICTVHILRVDFPLCPVKVLIEKKPQDTVIMEGETATLSCTTSDLTTPVTWRRNNITILNGDKYENRKEGKLNLLLIHNVDPDDSGLYSCDTGDMQSSAKLTVTGKDFSSSTEKQHNQELRFISRGHNIQNSFCVLLTLTLVKWNIDV